MGCVYSLKLPNGKRYVGMTRLPADDRIAQHLKGAEKGSQRLFYRALRRQVLLSGGLAEAEVLAEAATDTLLRRLERYWIRKLGTSYPRGYNLTAGGDGGILSGPNEARRRERMKITMATPEYKAKQAAIQKRVWTPEMRLQQSKRVHSYCLHHPEHRKHLSDVHKGQRLSEYSQLKRQATLKQFWANHPEAHERVSEQFRAMWCDSEHRDKVANTRAEHAGENQRRSQARWKDSAYRKKMYMVRAVPRIATQRTPEHRAKISAITQKLMESPLVRARISATLSEFGNCRFQKVARPVRTRGPEPRRIQRLWGASPDLATYGELFLLGWRSGLIGSALKRGWLRVVD